MSRKGDVLCSNNDDNNVKPVKADEISTDLACSNRQNPYAWVRNFLLFMEKGSRFYKWVHGSYKWVVLSKSRCRSNHGNNEILPRVEGRESWEGGKLGRDVRA